MKMLFFLDSLIFLLLDSLPDSLSLFLLLFLLPCLCSHKRFLDSSVSLDSIDATPSEQKEKEPRGVFHLISVSLAFIFSSLFSRFVIRRNDVWSTSAFPVFFSFHSCLLHKKNIDCLRESKWDLFPVSQRRWRRRNSSRASQTKNSTCIIIIIIGSVLLSNCYSNPFPLLIILKVLLSSNEFSYPFPLIHLSWYIFRDVCQREGVKRHHTNQKAWETIPLKSESIEERTFPFMLSNVRVRENVGVNG